MDRRIDSNGLVYLPNDRVTSPAIRERLWLLMDWALVLLNAKNFLIKRNLIGSVVVLTGYYDFVKRVFFHIRDSGYQTATGLVQADADQFKSWDYSGPVLRDLALLQGIVIQP